MRLNWVAEILLLGVSLTSDLGGDFIPGNRINTYWDDVAEDIVVKLEEFSYSYGSNVGIWGDNGDYQTAESGWLQADAQNELHGVPSLVKSGDIVNFTAKYTHAYTGKDNRIGWQIIDGAEVGKTYFCSCQVRTTGASPLGPDALQFQLRPRYPFMSLNQDTQVTATQASADGTWRELRTWITILSASELDPIVELRSNAVDMTLGGVIYFDQFYAREDLHAISSESVITAGPDLGTVSLSQVSNKVNSSGSSGHGQGAHFEADTLARSVYQFCSSTSLNRFFMLLTNPAFPYTQLEYMLGHPNCAANPLVCNIHFVGNPVVTPASNPVAADGSITVLAISGLSVVRYTYQPGTIAYLSLENSNGVFTGLRAGVYRILAGDAAGCQISIAVNIPSTVANDPQPTNPEPTYGVKYRLEHDDQMNLLESRTDILERNYLGDPITIKGGVSPVIRKVLTSVIHDKFECRRPTSIELNLVSERDLQFIGLFSQDDRKFKVQHYKPVGTLLQSGFILPSVFSESYTQVAPYYTTINVSDNINSLDTLDFLDSSGNDLEGETPLIEIIAIILSKLSLGLDIRVACNLQSENDTYDEPQALEKTTMEMSAFYERDGTPWACSRVIEAILQPFGAKILQEFGVWNIVRIEEQTEQYDYRVYDKDGQYGSSSSFDPIIEILDPTLRLSAVFSGQDHTLEVVPAYGSVELTRGLNALPNLIRNGSFNDFTSQGIDGWTVDSSSGVIHQVTNIKEAIQVVRNGNIVTESGSTALEISNIDGQQAVRVYPLAFPVEYSNSDSFTFAFDHRINLTPSTIDRGDPSPLWVKIAWRLQIGDYFFNTVTGWTLNTSQITNDIYTDSYNTDEHFEAQINFRNVPTVTTESVNITFILNGSNYTDFSTVALLRAIATVDMPVGKRVRGHFSTSVLFYYTLVASTEADTFGSTDEWIRPTDYNGSTNTVVWHLDTYFGFEEGNDERRVGQIYMDEVSYVFSPNKTAAPAQEIITTPNNGNFKEVLDTSIESGDLPSASIHSKRFIYDNYFKDASGFPTALWTRANVSESTTIQTILAKSLVNQYKYPTFKVSGSLLGLSELSFLTTLQQTSEADAITISNEEFTSDISGWQTRNPGYGIGAFVYGSDSARVIVDDDATPANDQLDSLILVTPVDMIAGTRLLIEMSVTRSASTSTRSDWVLIVFMNNDTIVQTAVVTQFDYDGVFVRGVKLSVAQDCNYIGFKIKNLPLPVTGQSQYDVNYFRVSALDVRRYFTVQNMSKDEANNAYQVDIMQLVPVVASADPTIDDSGEGNTNTEGGAGGGTTGSGSGSGSNFSGDFNNDFGGDYDTILS